jgi:hypothetical protein
MLTGNALLAALEILPQQRLRGEFWRVVTASSLLGLEIQAGRTTVTRRFPDWLYAGGPTLNGGGPMTLYVASSEQAANAEWSAGPARSLSRCYASSQIRFFHRRSRNPSARSVRRKDSQRPRDYTNRTAGAMDGP